MLKYPESFRTVFAMKHVLSVAGLPPDAAPHERIMSAICESLRWEEEDGEMMKQDWFDPKKESRLTQAVLWENEMARLFKIAYRYHNP